MKTERIQHVGELSAAAPRLLNRLGMAGLVAFGVVRRLVTRPARLFHGHAEADRMRDQREAQRLTARHFRGGRGL
jgi:hypothetical protein